MICDACVGTTHEGHLVVFITEQNLVGIDAVVLIICTFFDFRKLAWKRLFTPQNCFFDPLNGDLCKESPKGTSLRESASFEPSCVTIRRRVWPVSEFPTKGINKNNFGYISPAQAMRWRHAASSLIIAGGPVVLQPVRETPCLRYFKRLQRFINVFTYSLTYLLICYRHQWREND